MRSCSTAVFVNREPAGGAGSTRDRRTDFPGLLDPEVWDITLYRNFGSCLPVISQKAWIFMKVLPLDVYHNFVTTAMKIALF